MPCTMMRVKTERGEKEGDENTETECRIGTERERGREHRDSVEREGREGEGEIEREGGREVRMHGTGLNMQ